MPTKPDTVQRLHQAWGFHYSTFAPLENLPVLQLFLQKSCHSHHPSGRISADRLQSFLESVGLAKKPIISLKQIHSGKAIMVPANEISISQPIFGEADALFTNCRDFYISVRVADCLPVYVYDFENKIVGLIHAGWRGTLLGIARNSIMKAKQHFGLNPEKCRVILGPYIKPCCYQVSGEVALLFSGGSIRIDQGSHYLDLAKVNDSQLVSCGIPSDNIFVAGDCTCCNPEIYHSFRRTGDQNGRMYAVLGLK